MMLRFVRLLAARGVEVVPEVQRELFGLVWQSLAGHTVQVIPCTDEPRRVECTEGVAAHLPMMSLPARLGVRGEADIPRIAAGGRPRAGGAVAGAAAGGAALGRGRADTPWYLGMRLLRQPSRGDWDSVVAGVVVELAGVEALHR